VFEAPSQFSTKKKKIEFEFEASDRGSGLVGRNKTCQLLEEETGIRREVASEDCVSPISYTLAEGRYCSL